MIPQKRRRSEIIMGVEFETDETIDGKTIYKKVIDFGTMPNNTAKSIEHGILNGDKIYNLEIICNYVSGIFGCVYFPHTASLSQYMELQITTQNIFIATNKDMSNFSAIVTIYYTKK